MPLIEDTRPRWIVRCDECGQDIGSDESGGTFLFDDRADALANSRDWDWLVDEAGVVTCESCAEEARIVAETPEGTDDA